MRFIHSWSSISIPELKYVRNDKFRPFGEEKSKRTVDSNVKRKEKKEGWRGGEEKILNFSN